MFKLYKKLTKLDVLCVVLIVGLTIGQVYFTMTIVDYMQGIIKAIMLLNYHNNPSSLGENMSFLTNIINNGGWDAVKAMLESMPIDGAAKEMILKIANASTDDIWYNGGMMLLYALGTVFAQMAISVIASFVAANFGTRIRSDIYEQVEGFSLEEINKFQTPSLITRTTNDIEQVQMANLMMMRMIFAAPVTAVWAILKIKATSTELTIASGVAIIILIIIIAGMMLAVLPKFKKIQKLTDKLNGVTRENLTGIRIVRAYNAEAYQEEKFETANKNMTNVQIFVGKVMSLMSPAMMIIMNGISLAIYWIGASLINKGTIDYATVTAFMMLSSQIIMSFVMLMMMFIMWPRASVSAKRINEVLDTKSKIHDPLNEKEKIDQGTVEFQNVSFKYSDGDSNVVSNVSFKAQKGDTVAFIGSTGSGKSTLINLVPRIYDVSSGAILVDGVDIREMKQKTLRTIIGYVAQKGLLFRGTVKDNIKFGNPDLADEEVVRAARISCSEEFISSLENGYDYEISQGGKNVSGGQKQRLCIARAIAINPEILIFDDSFSALDYKTDKKVRDNLKKEAKDITKLIVAQRIGTIMDADQIIVLEQGNVVGIGRHEELLKNCEVYKEIALSQLTKEELGL